MIYLYGLLDAAVSPNAFDGVDGISGPVHATRCGGWTVIHGGYEGEEVMPRRRYLLRHAAVLEAAMVHGALLPMRFGMLAASISEVEDRLATQKPATEAAFDRVRGRVELGVRVTVREVDALEQVLRDTPDLARLRDDLAGAGRSGHFAKAEFGRQLGEAAARQRARAQKSLLKELSQCADDHVLRAPESDFEALRAEFLVPEARVSAFSDRLAAVCETLDFAGPRPANAHIVGPGPAYHFVTLALGCAPGKEAA
ncbi:MAG: GvpL/GvpF family gas vesicle protein [Pseudomonadota bacterium]